MRNFVSTEPEREVDKNYEQSSDDEEGTFFINFLIYCSIYVVQFVFS